MAKRAATTDLNHTNWEQEEEPEEAGVFQKASSEVLEARVIKTAKRRAKMSDSNSGVKSSPFSAFSGFGNASSSITASSPFSFLNQNKKSINDGGKIVINTDNNSLSKDAQTQFKPFANSFLNTEQEKDSETTFKPFEHIFKQSAPSNESGKKGKDLEMLKDLNLSCSSWISEHLEKNPYCILTPIFKDYEKHLEKLELNAKTESTDESVETHESSKLCLNKNSTSDPNKSTNGSKENLTEGKLFEKDKDGKKEFKLTAVPPSSPFNLPFGSVKTSFGPPSTFNLNQIAAKPVTDSDNELKKDEEDSEEPPKTEFVPVIEEDSIFDMKCKIFVKKAGNFVSRGIGTLFLKPVKDSTKTQVVVRAHTNLGNILLNILLVPGTPIQKTGKNNAMIICVPTPEAKPPPVPVLIRVKTSEECDTLIKKLEECRGS